MKWIIRSEEISRHGKYPGSRSINELLKNGIIILDKWQGPTSHDTVSIVKKLLGREKTGHSGTIDPLVSGVLIVTLDNACKVIPALQGQDKEYVGVLHLHKDVSMKELKETAKKYVGIISQTPPIRSAVKRQERKRRINFLEILQKKGKDVLFRVSCQAGTYIRVLCHQIGKDLGGGHMKELRRTSAGRFTEKNIVKIQDLADAYVEYKEHENEDELRKIILPVESAIEHLGKIIVKDSTVYSVANGSPLYSSGISRIEKAVKKSDMIALLTLKGELIALATAKEDAMNMKTKKIAAKIDRVIITENYPKK